jgi:hypothetical protein
MSDSWSSGSQVDMSDNTTRRGFKDEGKEVFECFCANKELEIRNKQMNILMIYFLKNFISN